MYLKLYNHFLYIGYYRNKAIFAFAEIKAVVDLDNNKGNRIYYKNIKEDSNEDFIKEAQSYKNSKKRGYKDSNIRIFLTSKIEHWKDGGFRKESPGGMIGSKRYFDLCNIKNLSKKKVFENKNIIKEMSFKEISNKVKEGVWK